MFLKLEIGKLNDFGPKAHDGVLFPSVQAIWIGPVAG